MPRSTFLSDPARCRANECASSSSASTRATCLAVAPCAEDVVIGFADGSLMKFSKLGRVLWRAVPPTGYVRERDDDDDVGGVDAIAICETADAVGRFVGGPTRADVLTLGTGTPVKELAMPVSMPAGEAFGSSGSVGWYIWATTATCWRHTGDLWTGNSSRLHVWRADGDGRRSAYVSAPDSRRRIDGPVDDPKSRMLEPDYTLVPFASVRGLDGGDGGVEFLSVVINFHEQNAVLERRAYEFTERLPCVSTLELESPNTYRRVNLGWIPKFVAIRDKAFNRDMRTMPSMATCVDSNQFYLVIWPDGEQPVHVIDRKMDASNSSRRYMMDALSMSVSSCITNPDARTKRTVVDARMHDGDAVVAIVVRDAPIPQKWESSTPRDEDVDFKMLFVPTGFRVGAKSLSSIKPKTVQSEPLIDFVDVATSVPRSSESCTICLDEIERDGTVHAPCCSASFCEECLTAYILDNSMKGCPMCRNVENFSSMRSFATESLSLASPASFEVDAPFTVRQQLKRFRLMEQVVDGDYAALDEHHMRGDRSPLAYGRGVVVTLTNNGADVRDIISPRDDASCLPKI
ncbi:Zinc finger, RING/FYVE/PHD-type [Ostreococcus tauri]|uniref:Zinc finger, RING/FYVE/PHD-type n=1 Tax=Ostreococcus tauri TaxID=70448 RepID=A0A090LXN8_OSTTA|nr:Zinc finger, RING/FYVE/PHD-type [Ostreococcus tauri]CEF96571.1 Zinc finger, RING/FYVE/PHD-type [Ostreococcus tauri]|eukprot:XP_003074215.2 Zinc finger, RING/FYVE/PHD-type [Ostreococcus tauri]